MEHFGEAPYKERAVAKLGRSVQVLPYKDDIVKLVYQELRRIKPRKPKVPTKPDDTCFDFSSNGYFMYRESEEHQWACCSLTEDGQTLVKAILKAEKQALGYKAAFALFGMDDWKDDHKERMKNITKGVNRILRKENVPIRLSTEGCVYQFCND